MTKEINFDELKDIYLQLLEAMPNQPINENDLLIDYSAQQCASFHRGLELLGNAKAFLEKARVNDDKIAMQVALVYIRVHSMNLSSFFDAFKEDADALLKSSDWPDIPEDYEIPSHYNYPVK
ncbi:MULTISPECIES: hypothetical protein [unclassified Pantoea]|uniref:hypothetical protein n=1 Tax=unclassified Pantoea TaxID=2630326 RepID=UPI000D35D3D0|nr:MULTISPECIES: hypothetical protein [unclassified Pantoea]NIE72422.1 hypothetical protein [Pantoea sp. Acro-807]RAU29630.1 hypothetical protein DBY66_015520 [Pantoea sp. RIT 413]